MISNNKEFVAAYCGRKVKLTKTIISSTLKDFSGWVGVVDSYVDSYIGVKTIEQPNLDRRYDPYELSKWMYFHLELIEDELDIKLPINNHTCPNCEKQDCNGLQMIECILGGK